MDTLSKNIYRLYTDKAQAAATGALKRSREELPHVRGQGGRPRGDTKRPRSGAATRGVTPRSRSGVAAWRRYPTPEARGGGREDQPQAVAAQAQEGLEELSHVEGQEGRW